MTRPDIIRLAWLAGILFLITSCHTHRKVLNEPLKEQGPEYLFEQLKKNEFNYHCLSLKFDASVTVDGEDNSFSGNLYIVRDSIIWLSIHKFGLEAVRILMDNDTVRMMNRLSKTYFIGDFSVLNSMFKTDFDFDILQAVLTGNDVRYYEDNVFKATVDNRHYRLSTLNRHKLKKYARQEKDAVKVLIQDIWLDPLTFKITRLLLKEFKDVENRKFECEYSDFVSFGEQLFAEKLSFRIVYDKKVDGVITFTRISPEKAETFPFRIPESYTRTR